MRIAQFLAKLAIGDSLDDRYFPERQAEFASLVDDAQALSKAADDFKGSITGMRKLTEAAIRESRKTLQAG
jgi:hypothetical protein